MTQQAMYAGVANSPQTELASAIDDTQNTIPLVDASMVPAAPNLATIGIDETAETVLYTGKSGNDLTGVTRGFEGAAKSWSAGAQVARNFTAYDHNSVKENVEDHETRIASHQANTSNPHNVTTEQVNKISAKLVGDLPALYPIGLSVFSLSSVLADPWKTATGHVGVGDTALIQSAKVSGDYLIVQRVTFTNGGTGLSSVYERTSTANNSWTGAWVKVVSRSEFDDLSGEVAAHQAETATGVINAEAGLKRWRSKLSRVRSGVANQKARICFIGDSITEGAWAGGGSGPGTVFDWATKGYVRRIQDQLTAIYGDVGTGFMPSYYSAASSPKWSFTGTWNYINGYGGIADKAMTTTINGDNATFEFNGTGITIVYTKHMFAGTFTYSVDGSAPVTVNANNATMVAGVTLDITGLSQGDHSVVLTNTSSDKLILTGAIPIKGSSGVIVNQCALNGSKTAEHALSASLDCSINALQPDLTIISLTTNDFGDQTPIDTFKANLQAIITRAKQFGDVALTSVGMSAASLAIPQSEYFQAVRDLARINDVAFLDLASRWGGNATYASATLGLMTDGVHPNDFGHRDIASFIISAITQVGELGNTSTARQYDDGLYRQALVNGNFDVWQKGTSLNATGGILYVADRWMTLNSTTNQAATVSRQDGSGVPGSRYCLRYQRNSGQTGTNPMYVSQSLESIDSKKLVGNRLTLTFWARKGVGASMPSISALILSGTGTDQNVINGLTGQVIEGSSISTLTTSWQKFTLTIPNAVLSTKNQIALYFVATPSGTAGASDYFEIAQVQLNTGSEALPFQPRSYADELALCRRYFQQRSTNSVSQYDLSPPMRTNPTVTGSGSPYSYDAEIY